MARKKAETEVHYCRRPDRDDFELWQASVEEELWWKSAEDNVLFLNHTACPASWTFTVLTSDFWVNEDPRESLVPALVSACPDFMKTLACGNYDKLFEYHDLGSLEYRKKHPRKWARMWMPRSRSAIEGDIMTIWAAATTETDHALPLSRCEKPADVLRILKRARRELDIKPLMDAYAAGADASIIGKAVKAGMDVSSVLEAYSNGVPEEDLFV